MFQNPCLRIRGGLFTALWVVLGMGVSLCAQSYQTGFKGETFDRSKAPATFHGGVEVDGPTGAVSFNLPLGPGIGLRGLTFRPVLSGKVSPKMDGSSRWEAGGYYSHTTALVADDPFSFSPGAFDLGLSNDVLAETEPVAVVSNYTLPGGDSGSLGIAGWGIKPSAEPLPGDADLATMLGLFGYASGTTYGFAPWRDGSSQTGTTPFRTRDSNGCLVLGLAPSLTVRNTQYGGTSGGAIPADYWHIPERILVVRGEVAFEFTYVMPNYQGVSDPYALPNPLTNSVLRSGHYRISRMLNRFGESISFTYGTDGASYTAAWMQGVASGSPGTPTGAAIQVTATWGATRNDNRQGVTISISYTGMSQAPAFTLAGASRGPWPGTSAGNDPLVILRPELLTTGATGEQVSFGYGNLPAATGPVFGATSPEPALSSITFPNRTISFAWTPFLYVRNRNYPGLWNGYVGVWDPNYPSWTWGVSQVDDLDQVTGVTYTTRHARTVPVVDYSAAVTNGPIPWASTQFHDAVTHPDGSVTVFRYAEPCQGTDGRPASGASEQLQMRTLAHLKQLTTEIRHYTPQTAYAWASELNQPGAQSSAFKVELFDRWDLRSQANPAGAFNFSAVPFPTRTRSWERETGILQTEERTGWDSTGLGWGTLHGQAVIQASPDLVRPDQAGGSANVLSLTRTGSPAAYPEAASAAYRTTASIFNSDYGQWFLSRLTLTQATVNQDGTGNTTLALPANLAPTSTNFGPANSDLFNRVSRITVGASSGTRVLTDFSFANSSGGLGAGELTVVNVTGSSDLTVPAGGEGASYGYDPHGFLSTIQPLGVAWNLQQGVDLLGRPAVQTDANALQTFYGRDAAGRLQTITPPDNLQATVLAYDDASHRGVTVTRGQEGKEYRYSGLGQLLLIRRWDAATTSYKVFGYDSGGRKTFESIWYGGSGSDTAGMGSTSLAGDRWEYDGQGRLILHTDPNSSNPVVTRTTYEGLTRTVRVGAVDSPLVTTYTIDALRRLTRVVDAVGQVTTYRYDPNGSIGETRQSNAAQTLFQTRSWSYHPLGWLSQLIQPESGTTTYGSFTVGGKPGSTTHVGDGSGASRSVTTSYGSLERAVAVTSADGSVSQSMVYDVAAAGGWSAGAFGKANGKLIYTQDKGVEVFRAYNGAGGALSDLDTRTWTGTAPSSGSSYLFPQAFSYDAYGNRVQASAGRSFVETSFDLAKGLPKALTRNQAAVVTATLDGVTWNLAALAFTNGATSSFSYDQDQTRLHSMTHGSPGAAATAWTYSYDSGGRMTGDAEDSYGFDNLGRLTSATVVRPNNLGTVTQTLTYDAFGNAVSNLVTGSVPASGTQGYNINNFAFNAAEQTSLAARNRIPATASALPNGIVVPTGAQYDAQGNLTQIYHVAATGATPVTLAYDALGRVTDMWDNARPGFSERYLYSAEGLRTVVEEYQSQALQKRRYNIYNDAGQLVTQYESTAGALASTAAMTRATSAKPAVLVREPAGAYIATPAPGVTVARGVTLNFVGETDFGKTLSWNWGDGTPSGSGLRSSHSFATAGAFTVVFTASATGYTTSTARTTVNVSDAPAIPAVTTFTASGTTLTWATTGATSVTILPDLGTVAANGSQTVAPRATTAYRLTATNALGSATAIATILVEPSGLTWKRDIAYLGAKETASFDSNGIHVTQVDHLGSPRIVTNGAGAVESRLKYLPFGETLDQTGSLTTGKGFTNHEQTDASGLIYMQARYYLPQYHRFTSPDPARDQHYEATQSWNIYSYCQNQPVTSTDPTGMLKFRTVRIDGVEMPDPSGSDPGFTGGVTPTGPKPQSSGETAGTTPTSGTGATTSSTAQADQYAPLTPTQISGKDSPQGDLLPPRTPGAGEVQIDLASRPIDTSDMKGVSGAQRAVVGYMEHSALIVTTLDGRSVVQSGPTNPNGTGQNLAGVTSGPGGAREAASFVNTQLSYIVPASVAGRIPGLVQQWNAANVQYSTTNLKNPGPNSNTFTHWMANNLGLKTFSSGFSPVHPLPGWGFKGPLP